MSSARSAGTGERRTAPRSPATPHTTTLQPRARATTAQRAKTRRAHTGRSQPPPRAHSAHPRWPSIGRLTVTCAAAAAVCRCRACRGAPDGTLTRPHRRETQTPPPRSPPPPAVSGARCRARPGKGQKGHKSETPKQRRLAHCAHARQWALGQSRSAHRATGLRDPCCGIQPSTQRKRRGNALSGRLALRRAVLGVGTRYR